MPIVIKSNAVNILYKERYFYLIILLLFIVDIFSFSLLEKQIVYGLLCFYCISLYKETSIFQLFAICLLIALESSFHYNIFGLQLVYILPITLIGFQSQKTFYGFSIQPYILLICCLLIECLVIEPFGLKIPTISAYTPVKIIANIIVLWCISLIDNSQGKLGNRFDAYSRRREESPDSQ